MACVSEASLAHVSRQGRSASRTWSAARPAAALARGTHRLPWVAVGIPVLGVCLRFLLEPAVPLLAHGPSEQLQSQPSRLHLRLAGFCPLTGTSGAARCPAPAGTPSVLGNMLDALSRTQRCPGFARGVEEPPPEAPADPSAKPGQPPPSPSAEPPAEPGPRCPHPKEPAAGGSEAGGHVRALLRSRGRIQSSWS